jgi:caa(3)-type oxidase subunit IV
MSSDSHTGPGNVTIWVFLVLLLAAGFVVFELNLSKTTAILLIFGIALVKAFLVLRHYMHLKGVPPMLYAIAGVPLILAIFMVLALMPDIGHNYRDSLPAAGAEHAEH